MTIFSKKENNSLISACTVITFVNVLLFAIKSIIKIWGKSKFKVKFISPTWFIIGEKEKSSSSALNCFLSKNHAVSLHVLLNLLFVSSKSLFFQFFTALKEQFLFKYPLMSEKWSVLQPTLLQNPVLLISFACSLSSMEVFGSSNSFSRKKVYHLLKILMYRL